MVLMAEAACIGGHSREPVVQPVVSCPLCHRRINRKPLTLLPCQHTVCDNCIQTLSRESGQDTHRVECPLCPCTTQMSNDVRPSTKQDRHNNIAESSTAGVTENSDKVPSHGKYCLCVQCVGSGSQPISEQYDSKNKHSKPSKDNIEYGPISAPKPAPTPAPVIANKLHPMKEHNASDAKLLSAKKDDEKTTLCATHPCEKLDICCLSCKQTICIQCKLGAHSDHRSEDVHSIISRLHPVITAANEQITKQTANKRINLGIIQRNIKDISNNKASIREKLEQQKAALLQQFTEKLDEEISQICEEMEIESQLQIQQMEVMRKDIEDNIATDESIQSTVKAAINKGGNVMALIQADTSVALRLKQSEQEFYMKTEPPQLYEFIPYDNIQPTLSTALIGHIKPLGKAEGKDITSPPGVVGHTTKVAHHQQHHTNPSNRSPPMPATSESASGNSTISKSPIESKRYRVCKYSLRKLHNMVLKPVKQVPIGGWAGRLCLFRNMLWIPCHDDKSIKVFSPDGRLLQTLKPDEVQGPCCLHPLGPNRLVVAAQSGLYILDYKGQVKDKLDDQWFVDLHVESTVIAALTFEKVILWKMSDKLQVINSFTVKATPNASNSMLLSLPHIYVGEFCSNRILKYNLKGECVGQFGSASSINFPRLSMRDEQYNILVSNTCSNNITVLSDRDTAVFRIKTPRCRDTIIIGDIMYVLTIDNKIVIYKIK